MVSQDKAGVSLQDLLLRIKLYRSESTNASHSFTSVYPQQKEAQTITEQWINEEALSSLNQNLWRTVRREKLKNIKLQSTEHEMLTIYYKKIYFLNIYSLCYLLIV